MKTPEALDKLRALSAMADQATLRNYRVVALSPGDAEALRLAIEILKRAEDCTREKPVAQDAKCPECQGNGFVPTCMGWRTCSCKIHSEHC